MSVSPFLRPLGIAASILGTLQGLTWTILSLLVAILASKAWVPDEFTKNYFNNIAYGHFFSDHPLFDVIFTGTTVLAFACIYLAISFIWTVASMTLTWMFLREKYDQVRLSCICWSAITIFTTVMDFILIIILGIDLGKIKNDEEAVMDESFIYIFRTVVGIAMTIVARGYVLLIINPIIATFLFIFAKELSQTPNPTGNNRPFINAYQNPNVFDFNENPQSPGPKNPNNYNSPRSLGPENPNKYYNPNFLPDEDPAYHRSVSQHQEPPLRRYHPSEPAIPGRPPQKPRAPQVPIQMQRDSRDNNNMRDPRNVLPHIPAPDYDNPRRGELERMPRSALRTKSYY